MTTVTLYAQDINEVTTFFSNKASGIKNRFGLTGVVQQEFTCLPDLNALATMIQYDKDGDQRKLASTGEVGKTMVVVGNDKIIHIISVE